MSVSYHTASVAYAEPVEGWLLSRVSTSSAQFSVALLLALLPALVLTRLLGLLPALPAN